MHSFPTPSAKLKASRAQRTSNLNLRHQTKRKATWPEQATQKKPKLALGEGRTHIPEVEETVRKTTAAPGNTGRKPAKHKRRNQLRLWPKQHSEI